ncbi:hypothetical protein [Bradyrhizobium prioriisuperbiae]|uniref:hypothetical protein n=1 Tax=Bradyrhizobium prioriisuperbiae TaxID=2854389 RepID=UPI0028E737C5|nr:hypothetical protein [Bradyrhizobium prioritasuperba]
MKRLKRCLVRLVFALVVIAALIAFPILRVEHSCIATPVNRAAAAPAFNITDANYRRAEGNSFLSYPEWYIVHAYADLAGVTARASESAFDYLAAISGFWSSLCSSTSVATRIGAVTADQKTTNYVIGISFTLEMAIQGLYERTVGALTARQPAERTAEDAFNLRLLQEYAAFLQQTPWYQYPFKAELGRLWSEVPFHWSVRSVERRVSLSLQYGVKALYAAAIRYAAGYAPADLTIKSVVGGLDQTDVAAEPRIKPIREITATDGTRASLIETPRYQALTEIIQGLGARRRTLLEIAGNRRILTTVIVPPGKTLNLAGAVEIFSIPIQSDPGARRLGFDTTVTSLAAQAGAVEAQGGRFEHAYDY